MLAGRHRELLQHRHSGARLFGAGPESILTMVVMDSGLAAEPAIGPRFARTRWRRPGMTAVD
jgi:hypothetical protein